MTVIYSKQALRLPLVNQVSNRAENMKILEFKNPRFGMRAKT